MRDLAVDAMNRFDASLVHAYPPLSDRQVASRLQGATLGFEVACETGDPASCRRLLAILSTRKALALVRTHCALGDRMSCRAVQSESGAPPGDPRALANKACMHAPGTCDAALRRECADGWPLSCLAAIGPGRDGALEARFLRLAKVGCAQGLLNECEAIMSAGDYYPREDWVGPPRTDPFIAPLGERLFAGRQACLIGNRFDDCASVVVLLANRDPMAARDLAELNCQRTPQACWFLGRMYVEHSLPEPVPDRGMKVLEYTCRELGSDRDSRICEKLKLPTKPPW